MTFSAPTMAPARPDATDATEQQQSYPLPSSLAQQRPILVVEDSDEDYEAFLRVMKKLALPNPVQRCMDGDDCLQYLRHEGKYADSRPLRPCLILLDLNLPGTDGREVLERLEEDPKLRAIPVTVVTTSSNPDDVELCYRIGANSFVTKSHNWQRFEDAVRVLMNFWFKIAVLP